MPSPLEIATEKVDAMAETARGAINARLQISSQELAGEFWFAVAKLYARGLVVPMPILGKLASSATTIQDRTEREELPVFSRATLQTDKPIGSAIV